MMLFYLPKKARNYSRSQQLKPFNPLIYIVQNIFPYLFSRI